MSKPAKANEMDRKTERLRSLRLAQEQARRDAGIWGEMSVGEITHDASRSVFVRVWKGRHRPDPFREDAVRRAGGSGKEWMSMLAWIHGLKSAGFDERILAWDVSASEAKRIADERMAAHRAAGLTVVNPPPDTKSPARRSG